MARYQKKGRTTYGKKFRTRAGRYGSYKYVNGKRVGFTTSKQGRTKYSRGPKKSYSRRRY